MGSTRKDKVIVVLGNKPEVWREYSRIFVPVHILDQIASESFAVSKFDCFKIILGRPKQDTLNEK